jgi:HEAT repeat protein
MIPLAGPCFGPAKEPCITPDPVVTYALWAGLAIAALACAMLVLIIFLRLWVQRRDRVHADARARWTALLTPAPGAEPASLPSLPSREIPGFLEAWNAVHEPLGGRSTPFLARAAGQLGLETWLPRRLRPGRSFHTRIVAIIALGNVHSSASYRVIEPHVQDPNPIVSLCAARALMQIDSRRAISQFVPQITRRNDWSQGSLAAILGQAGEDVVTPELANATAQAGDETAPRLIRFLAGVNPAAAAPIIRERLRTATDERVLSTCLQVLARREDLDCARPLLAHPRWHVRMQAAATLGRLGVPGDEQRLIPILADAQWWVRYRAAQALCALPFIGAEGLRRIQAAQTDGYARDIAQQVLAEQAMGVGPEAHA